MKTKYIVKSIEENIMKCEWIDNPLQHEYFDITSIHLEIHEGDLMEIDKRGNLVIMGPEVSSINQAVQKN